jgi:hypothetical protein
MKELYSSSSFRCGRECSARRLLQPRQVRHSSARRRAVGTLRRGGLVAAELAHLDGWSQQVLVKQARVGIVTVHLLEAGLSHPRKANLEVIRCAFDPPASSSSTKAAVDQVRAYASGARNRQRIQMHSISKA